MLKVAKYVASYIVPLGGLDCLVFTGGIGEKSAVKRKRILGGKPITSHCTAAHYCRAAGPTGGDLL